MLEQRVMRVFAVLLREGSVTARELERAVASAVDMEPGESVAFADEDGGLRRAFVLEKVRSLGNA